MHFKRGVHPVISVSLLLIVAVLGIVGFQSFFSQFISGILTETETDSSDSVSESGIDNFVSQTLYLRNDGISNITITSVKLNGVDCYIQGTYGTGIIEFDLYNCINNLSSSSEVVVYTTDRIYSKKFFFTTDVVASFSYDSIYFVSFWDTTENTSGSSATNQIALPLVSGGTYNFDIDWGDGSSDTITTWNQAEATHTYSLPGRYLIKINGTIVGWQFINSGDRNKILEIRQWGPLRLVTGASVFQGCENFRFTGSDSLNLSGTNSLSSMFSGATNFNGDIGSWDTSNIEYMNNMFSGATNFNSDISTWNVSKVSNMQSIFFSKQIISPVIFLLGM